MKDAVTAPSTDEGTVVPKRLHFKHFSAKNTKTHFNCNQFLCQESVNRSQDSNKFSLGAPTPKRPKVGINHGKRRAQRREGAGDKAPECAIAAGRRVGRQNRCLVSVLAKTGINNIKKGQFILTNICTTSSLPDPQMHGSLNVRVPGHRGRLCVTAASENSQED